MISLPEDAEVVLHNYTDTADHFRPYEIMVLKHK